MKNSISSVKTPPAYSHTHALWGWGNSHCNFYYALGSNNEKNKYANVDWIYMKEKYVLRVVLFYVAMTLVCLCVFEGWGTSLWTYVYENIVMFEGGSKRAVGFDFVYQNLVFFPTLWTFFFFIYYFTYNFFKFFCKFSILKKFDLL